MTSSQHVKEKVYPAGKVPALEHDGKVIGESMDLLNYLDEHIEGPKLAPTEESKKQAAAELLEYTDTVNKVGFTGLSMKESTPDEIGEVVATAFDYLENALGKFSNEGPFLLGTFGLAMDKVEAYSSTKVERGALLELYKRMLETDYFKRFGIVSNVLQVRLLNRSYGGPQQALHSRWSLGQSYSSYDGY